MSEIKRYKHAYGGNYDEMELATDGEWVRWEQVKEFIDAMSKNPPKIDIDSESVDGID